MKGITCSRTLEKTLVRQGRNIKVQTTVNLTIPPEIEVIYEELSPPFCSTVNGTSHSGVYKTGSHKIFLVYQIIAHYHGTVTFPGGVIQISDRFFSATYPLTNASSRGPVLQIQPWPRFEQKQISGTKEFDKLGLEKGYSIRMFREYVPGDDLRHVDWKVSAKRGKLYIREFSSQINNEPMVIVDLPDREQLYDKNGFTRMVGSITGFIESLLGKKLSLSLLCISGANVTDIYYKGDDLSSFLTLIREEIHPQTRVHHIYRRKKRIDIRKIDRSFEQFTKNNSHEYEYIKFLTRIIELHHRHLVDAGTMQFTATMARIIGAQRMSEIIVYSLCEGDVSHIEEIGSMAHQKNIPFRIRMPALHENSQNRVPRPIHGEIVEVI
jgi:hypothetical protein